MDDGPPCLKNRNYKNFRFENNKNHLSPEDYKKIWCPKNTIQKQNELELAVRPMV